MKCDVLVVGAGPAGLGAAITSSKKGLKTILVEKSSEIRYPVKSSAFTQENYNNFIAIQNRIIKRRYENGGNPL